MLEDVDTALCKAMEEIRKRKEQAIQCAITYRKQAEQCDGMAEGFSQALFELSKIELPN